MMMITGITMASAEIICSHNISVSVSNGTDNTTDCWYNPLHPCSQLSDALDAVNHFNTDVCITVLDDVSLFKPVTMSNVTGIILRGGVHQVTIDCGNQGGLSFLQSNDILMLNLIFEKCLMEHNSTSFRPTNKTQLQFYTALYFSSCNNITISGVDVRYSNGTGMTLYDVNGYVDINNSSFHSNWPYNGDGGGGLYIEFTYSNPDGFHPPNNISKANYYIYNCNFTDNVADVNNSNDTLFIRPIKNDHLSFSRGGGISIYFKGNAQCKDISITKCWIIGNRAYWGAGIFAEFQDFSRHNNFIVDSTIIHNNTNPQLDKNSGTGGGGVRTGFIYYEPETIKNNTISFRNCQISNNSAYWGGGISYRTCPEQQVVNASNKLSLINCTLECNVARLGSAIDLTIWHGLPTGVFSPVIITNCQFLHNSVSYTYDDNNLLGKGALYIDTIPVQFTGSNNVFEGNDGSAMAVVSTGVHIFTNASILFYNNTGDKGGAIALLGGSWLTVDENTEILFHSNRANDKGGAIYAMSIGEHDLISSRNCFVRYVNSSIYIFDWNTNFTFVENEAAVAGDSIYTTTLLPCIWTASNASSYNLSEATINLFSNSTPFHYFRSSSKSGNHSEIATAASHFILNSTTPVIVFPGQLKRLPINITDDKGNNASSYTSFVVVTGNSSTYKVENNYISNQLIRLHGEPNSSFNLTMQTASTTSYSVKVPISIHHCPPGLCRTSSNTCGCNCNHRAYQGVASCDPDQYQSRISSLFWAGYTDEEHKGDDRYFVTAYCPNGFCRNTDKAFSNSDELDKTICQPQMRTGLLCGKCVPNTSVYSSSTTSQCGKCTSLQHHGKYFGLFQFTLYEIIPLVIFFLFLIIFNINLTSGPLNGFIFFSQVISSLAAYNHQFTVRNNNIVLLFYGIWNLDFLEIVLPPYCLMEGWTTLDVFAFHYISAIIPLVLILIVILMMNHGRMICFPLTCLFQLCHLWILSRRFGFMDSKPIKFLVAFKNKLFNPHSKVLHGLAATLVLSYAKFLSLSFLLVEPSVSLYTNWPNVSHVDRLRVLLEGDLVYFGRTHIKYAIPATIIIILCILPPLILLLRPTVHRCYKLERFLRRWLPLTRIDHFLNEFYSCYRPKCQWYASMYFFYRIGLLFLNCFTILTQQYILQQLFCTMLLLIHSIVQPYSSRLYNCIDGMILAVLLALSCLHEQLFLVSHEIIEGDWLSEYVGAVFVCVPLVYLLLYLLSIIIKHCYTTCKEIHAGGTENSSVEMFNLEEEHDQLYEENDYMLQPNDPQVNQQQDHDDNCQPLHSMVDDVTSSDSDCNGSPQVLSKYGTFFDQPANHVPHTS